MSEQITLTQEQINYFMEFARTMNSPMYGGYFNPLLANQFLKNINMSPTSIERDNVETMVANPKENEQSLRRLSQHLYNTQMPYKKLIHYFSDMLTFDISIYPKNINTSELTGKKLETFKKEYDKAWDFIDKLYIKQEFKKILLGMMLEDAKFVYLREGESRFAFQEMPSDWSIITSQFEYGYLYDFNLMYFQQMGADISGFDKEFKKYYNNALDMHKNKTYYPNMKAEMRNGQWYYWQQLRPEKAWVFKFHENFAGLVPPFLGLFIDASELDSYKKLQSTKTALDICKFIIGTIPRNKENKTGSKQDDFAIGYENAAKFTQLMNAKMPEGALFGALPFENIQSFEFNNEGIDIIGTAMKNFYTSSGSDKALFNSDKPNASTMKASTRIDTAFAERVYPQFESFINYHLNKVNKKIKFEAKLSGTIFDEEERATRALTAAQSGLITPELASSMHLTERQLRNGISLMNVLGYTELKPLTSSFVQSGKESEDNGRPTKKTSDLGTGEQTKDGGYNDNKVSG